MGRHNTGRELCNYLQKWNKSLYGRNARESRTWSEKVKKMLEEGRGTWDYTSIFIILAKKTNIEKFKVRVRGVKYKHR